MIKQLTVLLARVTLGWLLFYAGYSKVITFFTDAKDWSAANFLLGVKEPFTQFYAPLAGNMLVDYLNAYGLLLVGLCVMLGLFFRFAAACGIALMLLYYFAGFPPEHALFVDEHIVYASVLLMFKAYGAGRKYGLDAWLEKTKVVSANKWLLKVLG